MVKLWPLHPASWLESWLLPWQWSELETLEQLWPCSQQHMPAQPLVLNNLGWYLYHHNTMQGSHFSVPPGLSLHSGHHHHLSGCLHQPQPPNRPPCLPPCTFTFSPPPGPSKSPGPHHGPCSPLWSDAGTSLIPYSFLLGSLHSHHSPPAERVMSLCEKVVSGFPMGRKIFFSPFLFQTFLFSFPPLPSLLLLFPKF